MPLPHGKPYDEKIGRNGGHDDVSHLLARRMLIFPTIIADIYSISRKQDADLLYSHPALRRNTKEVA